MAFDLWLLFLTCRPNVKRRLQGNRRLQPFFFLVAGVVLPLLMICQNEFLLMSTKANTTDVFSKSRSSLEAAFAGNKNFSTQSVVGW